MPDAGSNLAQYEHSIQPMDVLSGLGSADRNLLAVSLSLFDDSTLINRLEVLYGQINDWTRKILSANEITAAAQSVRTRLVFWQESNYNDDQLRLLLYIKLRDSFNLTPRFTLSSRGMNRLACELTAAVIHEADPPDFFKAISTMKHKIGLGDEKKCTVTLSDVVQPVLKELTEAALKSDGSAGMVKDAQDNFIKSVRERLSDLDYDQQQTLLDSVGAVEMNDSAVRKILLTGGGLTAFSTSVGLGGFGSYILAAQASAFIPLVSGPALVSLVSVVSNPVTVIAATAATTWWVVTSTNQRIHSAIAVKITALLALQGLAQGRPGWTRLLESFSEISSVSCDENFKIKTIDRYRIDWESLNKNVSTAPVVNPCITAALDRPCKQEKNVINMLGKTFFPGEDEAKITAATSLFTLGDILYSAAAINPAVIKAADFSHVDDLSDPLSFSAFASKIDSLSASSAEGALNNQLGYVAEQFVASELSKNGHQVEFPDTSNQAGWDLMVDGKPFQVKCLDNVQGLTEHFFKYPDIPVLANNELSDDLPDEIKDKVFFVEGYTHELTSYINDQSMANGVGLLHPNVTISAITVIAIRQLLELYKGKITGIQAVEQILIDGTTRSGLIVVGGYAGGSIGMLMLGPAGALVFGSIIPVLCASQSNRVRGLIDNKLKSESYRNWDHDFRKCINSMHKVLENAYDNKLTILRSKYKDITPTEIGNYVKWRLYDEAMFINEGKYRLSKLIHDYSNGPADSLFIQIVHHAATSAIHPVIYKNEMDAITKSHELRPDLLQRSSEILSSLASISQDKIGTFWKNKK